MPRPHESDEWLQARVESWVETYKKAMTTPVVLQVVAELAPVGIATLASAVEERTGWHLTERGLYRTVQRLEASGFLAASDVEAPRTGARRKLLSLSAEGERYLAALRDVCLTLER